MRLVKPSFLGKEGQNCQQMTPKTLSALHSDAFWIWFNIQYLSDTCKILFSQRDTLVLEYLPTIFLLNAQHTWKFLTNMPTSQLISVLCILCTLVRSDKSLKRYFLGKRFLIIFQLVNITYGFPKRFGCKHVFKEISRQREAGVTGMPASSPFFTSSPSDLSISLQQNYLLIIYFKALM